MFEIYKPIIKKVIIALAKIAFYSLVFHYSLPGIENALGERLDIIHKYFPWVIGASITWVVLCLLLNILINSQPKDSMSLFFN